MRRASRLAEAAGFAAGAVLMGLAGLAILRPLNVIRMAALASGIPAPAAGAVSNFAPALTLLAGLLLMAGVRRTTSWRGAELGILAGLAGWLAFLWITAGQVW
jgi:hypothetical protein